jgi:hypothetical protein
MTLVSQLAALAAMVGTGVVYGTDVFCALAQRPALARADDATLRTPGSCHRSRHTRRRGPSLPQRRHDHPDPNAWRSS